MKIHLLKLTILFLTLRMSIGCGTIIHGSTQDIDIASNPSSAIVFVNGAKMGETPARLTLRRKDNHTLKITKEGYESVEVYIKGSTSAWIIGNIVFGGIPGCVIDLITGGAYDLAPERVDVSLPKKGEGSSSILIDQFKSEKLKEIRLIDKDGTVQNTINIEWVEE